MNNFVEFTLHLPFYDLFNRHWFDAGLEMVDDDVDFMALAHFFGAKTDKAQLTAFFENAPIGGGDIFVLMQPDDRFQFIYLDFFKEKTDQAAMVQLSVRCREEHEMRVFELLRPLVMKGSPRSALSIDWHNGQLRRSLDDPGFFLKGRTVHFW